MTGRASPNLVAVGDNCLDVYLNKDLLTVGGNALNVAVQWRRDGWSARYFGAVGDDPEGEITLREIETAGLSRNDVEMISGDTAVTLLRDQSGDRTFLFESFGVGENYMPAPRDWQVISKADWVHLGTNANKDLVRRLVGERVPFSLDVSTAHLALPLEGVPLVFASGPDEPSVPVEPLMAALRSAGARQVVLTCGSRGAYFRDSRGVRHAEASPTSVVDTCGAGDSFIATFITAFCLAGLDADDAMRKASLDASRTCTHLGGFPQEPRPIPDWLPLKYADVINRETRV
ncbi:PfkB family carbohydrate kinase [Mesorhizobium australicum]|uniref:PfkB family carbohydrate kinase n=1 Tax=Mesorhizobium australicum TaxID=536018 RepID=A0ACC6T908_9HYPH|nr:PfkB family carbohydrate kinase [Mesorhizobium sp. LNHC220B00]ESY88974.1 carbohydrate kinase [Mesorhizobium sp. LNHC220B00]